MNEEWKPVVGFEQFYEVSSFGRVKALDRIVNYKDGRSYLKREAILNAKSKQGYPGVSLLPRTPRQCVHTLVASAFLGPKPAGARTVNHKDGNKSNNHVENLEWASYAENNRHARLTRLNMQDGENCNLSKFSKDVVDAVRILWPSGRFTRDEIGGLFGMSAQHVYEIVALKSRKTS